MIGVLIVTYNSAEVIGACLDSLLALDEALEIVVVDNASTDATRREVLRRPRVLGIFNDENRGFAGAVNQGFEVLSTPYVLLLNPDTVLRSSVLPLAQRCDSDQAAGAVAGRLAGPGQTRFQLRRLPTPAALAFEALGVNRLWPSNPVNRRYRPAEPEREFEQPAAAFLLVRHEAWAQIGGFDESFHPLWFEDVDFAKRLREAGWGIAYIPEVVAEHSGGHSAARVRWSQRQYYWYGSLLRYASKHFTAPARGMVALAVVIACIPRMLAGVVLRKSFAPVQVYWMVILLAIRCLVTGSVGTASGPAGKGRQVFGGVRAAG